MYDPEKEPVRAILTAQAAILKTLSTVLLGFEGLAHVVKGGSYDPHLDAIKSAKSDIVVQIAAVDASIAAVDKEYADEHEDEYEQLPPQRVLDENSIPQEHTIDGDVIVEGSIEKNSESA